MPGPNIQVPGPIVDMFHVEQDENGKIISMKMTPPWAAFFASLQAIASGMTRSGTTSQRPTSSTFRWEGMPYLDKTTTTEIFLLHATSNVWIQSDGTIT